MAIDAGLCCLRREVAWMPSRGDRPTGSNQGSIEGLAHRDGLESSRTRPAGLAAVALTRKRADEQKVDKPSEPRPAPNLRNRQAALCVGAGSCLFRYGNDCRAARR